MSAGYIDFNQSENTFNYAETLFLTATIVNVAHGLSNLTRSYSFFCGKSPKNYAQVMFS